MTSNPVDINQLAAEINEKTAQLQALTNDLNKAQQLLFSQTTLHLFEKYPLLEQISFTAYTPYFNDGDECVYSAHTDYPEIVYDGEEYTDNDISDFSSETRWCLENNLPKDAKIIKENVGYSHNYTGKDTVKVPYHEIVNDKYNPEMKSMYEELQAFLNKQSDDFYKLTFGDHIKVIIGRDGVETEDYSHD